MNALCREGAEADDNNNPAPENAPGRATRNNGNNNGNNNDNTQGNGNAQDNNKNNGNAQQQLPPQPGSSSACPRLKGGGFKSKPKFKNFSVWIAPTLPRLQMFILFFPVKFVENMALPQTSKNSEMEAVAKKEFFAFLGLILMMSCFDGVEDCQLWWVKDDPNMFEGLSFCFHEHVPRNHFEATTTDPVCANEEEPPKCHDPFCPMHQMRQPTCRGWEHASKL